VVTLGPGRQNPADGKIRARREAGAENLRNLSKESLDGGAAA
jgi:hypothetical protein